MLFDGRAVSKHIHGLRYLHCESLDSLIKSTDGE